ncbi:aminoglycoside phosphotransferase family protein [Asanoa sp. WMMD1127]|uniref:phosphotransferase family protein n=1 Tax=Asanoa sp. WMMD1127 TaxID=3016107 RepID=UPI002415BC09|nr:aminoglycoside phosphotransferase family protein [Asanoa sp. WMMD1127]MDG4820367.1 aminoglycoside phosphotransferase family protein [Asanoa sp. WMMD1127]
MRWLTECTAEGVTAALREVVPRLGDGPVELRDRAVEDDPLWWSSTAVVSGRYVAKFAWSRPAAQRVAHELRVLSALAREPAVPCLPQVVAASLDPVLLVTERVRGRSLFAVLPRLDPACAGRQLARFLAALHDTATRARVDDAVGPLPQARHGPQHPVATRELHDRLGPFIRPDQRSQVGDWCDWADATLVPPRPSVLVHADLHGDNQVWAGDRLRLVVDFETAALAEPEYDLRALGGPGLLGATVAHYERISDRRLAVDRILAWHLRTTLGDVLWRGEAGRLTRRAAADRVDDLARRLATRT